MDEFRQVICMYLYLNCKCTINCFKVCALAPAQPEIKKEGTKFFVMIKAYANWKVFILANCKKSQKFCDNRLVSCRCSCSRRIKKLINVKE